VQDFLFAGLYKKFRFRAPNKKNIARQVFLKNHPRKKMPHCREYLEWHEHVRGMLFECVPIAGLVGVVIDYAREFWGVHVSTVRYKGTPIGWLPDDRMITVEDCVLHVWSVFGGERLTLVGHTAEIIRLSVHGFYIASGARDCRVRIWDGRTGECTQVIETWRRPETLQFLTTGHVLAGYHHTTVEVFNLDGERLRKLGDACNHSICLHFKFASPGAVFDLEFLESIPYDTWRLTSGYLTRQPMTWKTSQGSFFITQERGMALMWNNLTDACLQFKCSCICPLDDDLIVVGRTDGVLGVYNFTTPERVMKLKGHQPAVCAITQMPGGRLASASKDNVVRVWDLRTGKRLRKLHWEHQSPIKLLAGLNTSLIAVAADMSLGVWE
jgi:WD40 repeat protein